MTKSKIYVQWAFTENESEKAKSNRDAYNELKERYKILKLSDAYHSYPTQEQLDNNDIVYSRKACCRHGEYIVYKKPKGLTDDEMALICDYGLFNLCYGYSKMGPDGYYVFED